MRLSRLGAAAAAAALAIVPIAVFAVPAGAETTIDDVTFYGSSDFGQGERRLSRRLRTGFSAR